MAKLNKMKKMENSLKMPTKRKETNYAVKLGKGSKDKTCFTTFGSPGRYLLASPLLIMAKPNVNSFEYIIKEIFKLDFDKTVEFLSNKFNGEICVNLRFTHLVFKEETDAKKCKNYLNKFLREVT